jgi:sugar fermentation stimulation protein A
MKFEKPLVHGKLIQRYKRFLADVELDDGSMITAHCTNSGSMKSCLEEGAEVYLTHHNDPKRKTQYTWEMIKINSNWVGINTNVPNQIAYESIVLKRIPELSGYSKVEREKKYGDSRFDLKLSGNDSISFVEVKNVTLKEDHFALFPDAVTTRGKKHLEDLIKAKNEGFRAAMLYIVQRMDVSTFAPAKEIDPNYAETLKKAFDAGVEILVYQVKVTPEQITIHKKLDFEL